jgi:diguanylate cyclase (GGDEF)-like protein/PAS domain S-box-containing protein
MKQKRDGIAQRQLLRSEAEGLLSNVAPTELTAQPTEVLVHELLVHKVELEMQNEELRRAHIAVEEMRDRYIDLFEFAPVGYVTISRDGLISEINLTGCSMLGVDRKKLLNRRFSRFVAMQDADRWHRILNNMMKHPDSEPQTFELTMTQADGTIFYAHLDCLRREYTDDLPVLRVALVDISKLKQAETDLGIAAIAFESLEGIMITDANNVILRVNQAFTNITGYAAVDAIGKTPRILQSDRHDAAFHKAIWQRIHDTGGWNGEIWNKRKNGEIYPGYLNITAVKDQNGSVTNYVGTLTDITISKNAAEKIEYLAYYDQLTRLPNRRFLIDRLKQSLASSTRTGRKGALLFVDLDNFKILNDYQGHEVGDLLLQQVAQRLESCVREGDTVARLGGDEFVVILQDLSDQSTEAALNTEVIANKILLALSQPYQLAMHEYRNTASIGATLFNDHEWGTEDLLKQADIAMYQAKKDGRNTLRFFDPEMQEQVSARATMEESLRKAIPGQLALYYQMQANQNGKILGAEVLIRWLHPESGLIYPGKFIPLAEDTGLILPIGRWVLETTCTQLKAWETDACTRNLVLAVNVSAKQFHQSDFVAQVLEVLQQTEADPTRLKLELTESLLVENVEALIEKMAELKAKGVLFSLDDFGTGFSSLSYLKRLPLDQLKIDQSFVRDVLTDPNDAAIVRTIIALGHSLGLDVIAEGVETEAQRNFLAVNGCFNYQGYLFSKPVPVGDFEALLRKN